MYRQKTCSNRLPNLLSHCPRTKFCLQQVSMQVVIKPTFGEVPESNDNGEEKSWLSVAAVLGGAVVVAVGAFIVFGPGKKKEKKKRLKKRSTNNATVSAAAATGKSKGGGRLKQNVATISTASKGGAGQAASSEDKLRERLQAGFQKRLNAESKTGSIAKMKGKPATNPFWAHSGCQKVELSLLTGEHSQALQAFVQCLQAQQLNYSSAKESIGKRDFTPEALFMKCVDFFTFDNYRLANTAFAQANHKFYSDLQQGKTVDPEMMPATKYVCGFCMSELGDFNSCQKLGWQSRSTRELNNATSPPPGSLTVLRLVKESRETKVTIANAMPNQRNVRIAQAAAIGKVEVGLIKSVCGKESKDYLDALISTSKLTLQCNGIGAETAKYAQSILKEATCHSLFKDYSGEDQGGILVLLGMATMMVGETDDAVEQMLNGVRHFASLDPDKASETDRRNFSFFAVSLICEGNIEAANQVIDAVLGLPPPRGKRTVMVAFIDALETLKQASAFCKGFLSSEHKDDMEECIRVGKSFLCKIGNVPAIPSTRGVFLNMYPACYENLGYKTRKTLHFVDRLYVEALYTQSRHKFETSARACRLLIEIAPIASSDASKVTKLLSNTRHTFAKTTVALVGNVAHVDLLRDGAAAAREELELVEKLENKIDNETALLISTPARKINDVETAKISDRMTLNAQLGTIEAGLGNLKLSSQHFISSVRSMLELKEKGPAFSSKVAPSDVRSHVCKSIGHILAWCGVLEPSSMTDVRGLIDVGMEGLSTFEGSPDIQESKETLQFAFDMVYKDMDTESRTRYDKLHHSLSQNTAKTPAARVAWALLALGSDYYSKRQYKAACRYMTIALNLAAHLFSPDRGDLWAQLLRFWVPIVFKSGHVDARECGVSPEMITMVASILENKKLSTTETIAELRDFGARLVTEPI